jgi:hypothetical protein
VLYRLAGKARAAAAQQAAVEKLLILTHRACAPLLSALSALYHACHGDRRGGDHRKRSCRAA